MAVKVKPPLNVKRPSDELVVVDVYGGGQTPSKPVNLVQNLLEQTSNGLGKALSSVGGVGGLLNSAAGILINNKGINGKDFAKKFIGDVFPNAKAALLDVKHGVINSLAGAIGIDSETALSAYRNIKDGNYQNTLQDMAKSNELVRFYVEGQEIIKKAEDVDSLSDLFKVAGTVFSNPTFGGVLNMTEEFTALKSLVDTAVSLNAPELADYLIGNSHPLQQDPLLRAATVAAAFTGDVQACYGYVQQVNPAEVLNTQPDVMDALLGNYLYDMSGPQLAEKNMMVNILDQFTANWAGQVTGKADITTWTKASNDARELMYSDPNYRHIAAASVGVTVESFEASMKKSMPWVALAETNASNLVS